MVKKEVKYGKKDDITVQQEKAPTYFIKRFPSLVLPFVGSCKRETMSIVFSQWKPFLIRLSLHSIRNFQTAQTMHE